jgi:hypothetical protein
MIGQIIGYREFVDGTRRPICLDAQGQYVLDDEAERVYGVYLIPDEECCDLPVIVDLPMDARLAGHYDAASRSVFFLRLATCGERER